MAKVGYVLLSHRCRAARSTQHLFAAGTAGYRQQCAYTGRSRDADRPRQRWPIAHSALRYVLSPLDLDWWYRLENWRGHDLDDQKATIFEFALHRRRYRPVRDEGHAGFIGPLRVPISNRQSHRKTLRRSQAQSTRIARCQKVRKILKSMCVPGQSCWQLRRAQSNQRPLARAGSSGTAPSFAQLDHIGRQVRG